MSDVQLVTAMVLQCRHAHAASNTTCDAGNYTLSGLIGVEVCRKTVGVVGTGAIGACAARIWKASSLSMAFDDRRHSHAWQPSRLAPKEASCKHQLQDR